jgi:hypothetical protein
MADVEMVDAAEAPKAKAPVKTANGGELPKGKKRFEVKKVHGTCCYEKISSNRYPSGMPSLYGRGIWQ